MLLVIPHYSANVDMNGFEDVGAMFYTSTHRTTTTIVARLPAIWLFVLDSSSFAANSCFGLRITVNSRFGMGSPNSFAFFTLYSTRDRKGAKQTKDRYFGNARHSMNISGHIISSRQCVRDPRTDTLPARLTFVNRGGGLFCYVPTGHVIFRASYRIPRT